MEVNLSAAELGVICRRIFFALDFPAGIDIEVSESIRWLQNHKFAALVKLHEDLPILLKDSYKSVSLIEDSDTGMTLNVAGDLGYLALTESIDLICSKTVMRQAMIETYIREVKYVPLIFPLLVRRSMNGLEFELEGPDCRAVCRDGKIWLSGNCLNTVISNNVEDVLIRSMVSEKTLHFSTETLDLQKVHGDMRTIIQSRIYRNLKEVAAKSFVPSSEYSRSRGAGAEVDDDD